MNTEAPVTISGVIVFSFSKCMKPLRHLTALKKTLRHLAASRREEAWNTQISGSLQPRSGSSQSYKVPKGGRGDGRQGNDNAKPEAFIVSYCKQEESGLVKNRNLTKSVRLLTGWLS